MKLKTTASLILITLGMLSLQSICAQKVKDAESTKQIKIGYLDKEALMAQMPEMTIVRDSLLKMQNSYAMLYQQMEEERTRKIEELIKMKEYLSENLLLLKQKEINDLSQNLQFLQQIALQDINIAEQNLTTPIEQKIDSVVDLIGKEQQFTYITKVRWEDPITKQHFDIYPSDPTDIPFTPTGENILSIVKERLGLQLDNITTL